MYWLLNLRRVEWHQITLKNELLRIIARLSSKVFLGDELCHDERWLDITINYTLVVFAAAESLRMWPSYLRDIVHWFLPKCRASRAEVAKARAMIEPILKKRAAHKARLAAQGKKTTDFNDAIEWFENAAKAEGSHSDPVIAQLGLSLAAIHTTVKNPPNLVERSGSVSRGLGLSGYTQKPSILLILTTSNVA